MSAGKTRADIRALSDDELLRFAVMSDDELLAQPSARVGAPNTAPQAREENHRATDRSFLGAVGRGIGLTARSTLDGVGQLAGFASEPIRQGMNVGLRALGLPEAAPAGDTIDYLADKLRLPTPENAQERIVGDIGSMLIPATGTIKIAGKVGNVATGVTKQVANMLASNPGAQLASAAAAGASHGIAREAGAPDVVQIAAGLAGGLAAPSALSGVQNASKNIVGRISAMRPQAVLERVRDSLRQTGVDFDQLPARVRHQLQQEAAQALRHGELDPAAMARLADFKRVDGTTPTRGMLTQDPGQVTREQNLAKLQANTGITGARNLSQIQADNNAALVRAIDHMGADSADDAVAAGQKAIDALQGHIGKQQARVNDLYAKARDSAGRSFPLDGRAFADNALKAIDDNLLGYALPHDVRQHLNKISAGEVPFTVDYAEQLKTVIGNLQRQTQYGAARYALGLVRRALDDTPVLPLGEQTLAQGARAVNPGMLPATQGAEIGEQAVDAFKRARFANRSMRRQIERTPALRDLDEGTITPDVFTNKYVIGSAAKAADVQRLGRILSGQPQARDAVRTSVTQHLKNKALSGVPDDIGAAKFSASQFAKELKRIGDRKLRAFFDSEEVAQLHAISRVARLMTNQPVGSAVNNSNTSSATIGRVLDSMGTAGRGFKLLGVGDQIGAIQNALRQRTARRIPEALATPRAAETVESRLLPATLYGGLLPLSSMPPSQNDRGK